MFGGAFEAEEGGGFEAGGCGFEEGGLEEGLGPDL